MPFPLLAMQCGERGGLVGGTSSDGVGVHPGGEQALEGGAVRFGIGDVAEQFQSFRQATVAGEAGDERRSRAIQ